MSAFIALFTLTMARDLPAAERRPLSLEDHRRDLKGQMILMAVHLITLTIVAVVGIVLSLV